MDGLCTTFLTLLYPLTTTNNDSNASNTSLPEALSISSYSFSLLSTYFFSQPLFFVTDANVLGF